MSKWSFAVYNSPRTLIEEQLPVRRTINKIVLHYSAVPNPSVGNLLKHLEAIDETHRERGYMGIGYHIAVHPSGLVVACRPLRISGAHCRGHNNASVGVVMLSNKQYLQTNPPLLQWVTVDTLKQLCIMLGVDRHSVFLHRQLNRTECPPITREFEKYLHDAGFINVSLGGGVGGRG